MFWVEGEGADAEPRLVHSVAGEEGAKEGSNEEVHIREGEDEGGEGVGGVGSEQIRV